MARILVPIDFSKESYLALDWAGKLVSLKSGSTLYLTHVVSVEGDAARQQQLQEEARRKMKELRQTVTTDIPVVPMFPTGRVAEEVSRICKEERIDLVIMTTQGRFGKALELKGSITEETVRITGCPVLVLHMNVATVARLRERFNCIVPEIDNNLPL